MACDPQQKEIVLNKDNQSVFDIQGKCDILQDTFFSGKHLENNNFDKNFKLKVEKELKGIRSVNNSEELFDSVAINREVSLEETEASLEYLKPGKATGPDNVFTDLLLNANEELVATIHKLFSMSFTTGNIPLEWKKADVEFLRKLGKKNYNFASAYRPISLTKCLRKCL